MQMQMKAIGDGLKPFKNFASVWFLTLSMAQSKYPLLVAESLLEANSTSTIVDKFIKCKAEHGLVVYSYGAPVFSCSNTPCNMTYCQNCVQKFCMFLKNGRCIYCIVGKIIFRLSSYQSFKVIILFLFLVIESKKNPSIMDGLLANL